MPPLGKRRRIEMSDDDDDADSTTSSQQTVLAPEQHQQQLVWQQLLDKVSDRDLHILDDDLWTDCEFLVGCQDFYKKKIKCHRIFLAKTSPVFAAMLYGKLYQKDVVIKVPDISPVTFQAMLKYIYSGEIEVTSFDLACDLLYAAKKYLLPNSLLEYLRSYIWCRIYPNNVWDVIMRATNLDEPELIEAAWQVVDESTTTSLQLSSFLHVSDQIVKELCQRDTLACTEVQLFDACYRWAQSTLVEGNSDRNPKNLRKLLQNILPNIRLLTMTGEEFMTKIISTEMLLDKEQLPISLHLHKPSTRPLPKICSPITIKRGGPCRKKLNVMSQSKINDLIINNDNYKFKLEDNIFNVFSFAYVKLAITMKIIGLQIPSQLKMLPRDSNQQYEEFLSVFVIDQSTKEVLYSFEYKASVPYNKIIDILFPKPVHIAKVPMTFIVKVVLHRNGCYRYRPITEQKIIMTANLKDFGNVFKYYFPFFKFIQGIYLKEFFPTNFNRPA